MHIIPTTADAVEQVAWLTGSDVESSKPPNDRETTITTEGGVRLRLVAPLGGVR